MKTPYFLLLFVTLAQTACKKTNDSVQPSPPSTDTKQEKYSVVSIAYTALPGSSAEEITEQRPALEYTNRTQVRQRVKVEPDGLFERSTFTRDPQQTYLLEPQERLFSVPLEVQKEQISLGAKKWPYLEQETKVPTELNFTDSVYVDAGKKLITSLSFTYKKIRTAYTAQLQEQSSGKIIPITGIWTGVYPVRKNFTYRTENL